MEASRTIGSSHHDPVTGFGDHDKLIADLTRALEQGGDPSVLAVFDLMGFREYRRAFGLAASDALIGRYAAQFERVLESVGRCYRPRQDEFCALVDGPLLEVTPRIFAVEDALSYEAESSLVTVCSGTALLPDEADSPIDLLILADQRVRMRLGSRKAR